MFLNVSLASSLTFPHHGHVAKGDELRRVGRAVAARRGELGMTQQELADAAHVDLKTVYNLESGTRWPIARTRAAIAGALKWQGDALAKIAAGAVNPGELRFGLTDFPRDFPEATDEMAQAMKSQLEEIRMRVEIAMRRHPGEPLTGAMIFPASPLHSATWDAIVAAGWDTGPIPLAMAALLSWHAEASGSESSTATGLTAPALYALR